jgi:hypothetical protein
VGKSGASVVLAAWAVALVSSPLSSQLAGAADVEFFYPRPIMEWQAEFGARYWFSRGQTAKTLFTTGDAQISRLTYNGLSTHSGEAFWRIAHSGGWYFKGFVGGGSLSKGSLQDEDFAPFISPYSSTQSDQSSGNLVYGSFDVGFNVIRGGDFRLGTFIGYHYLKEHVHAYGCTQTATNPDICVPTIPSSVLVISQNNKWHMLRVGFDGAITLADRLTLSFDAAIIPFMYFDGADTHWLRIGTSPGDFTGPIPETGRGWGYQLEAILSFQFTPQLSAGVGARYWHMESNGHSHFENRVVGMATVAQPVDWSASQYGIFVQAGYKFGPYRANN